MHRRLRIALLVLAAAAAPVFPVFAADTYAIDKNHSDVSFTIRHFASKVRGRFADFSGAVQVDAAKNPEITFKSSKMVSAGKDKYDVTGTLTMRGVSKEITIPVAYLGSMKDPGGNDRASFELSTKLNRKDYGINWNKALDNGGFMLSDDVDVTISLETVKKKPEAPAAK